jgi:hypothetical protein
MALSANAQRQLHVALGLDAAKEVQTAIDAAANQALAQQGAYTQTYSTASKTHANLTAGALTDNTAGTANTTLEALSDGSTYANDVAAIRNNLADLAASNNAIIVDLTNLKQVVNALIDDLQALLLVG